MYLVEQTKWQVGCFVRPKKDIKGVISSRKVYRVGELYPMDNGFHYKFRVDVDFALPETLADVRMLKSLMLSSRDFTLATFNEIKEEMNRQVFDRGYHVGSSFECLRAVRLVAIEDVNIKINQGASGIVVVSASGGYIAENRVGNNTINWAKVNKRGDGRRGKVLQVPVDEKVIGIDPFEDEEKIIIENKNQPLKSNKMSLEKQIFNLVETHVQGKDVMSILEKETLKRLDSWGIAPSINEVHIVKPSGDKKVVGKQHYKFPLVLKALSAKTNVALVGAAGSGKTTVVLKCAEALGLEFYSKSVSLQTGTHEFFGYQDANGNYVRTLFREAYENGGVFLLDEFDAGNPNVLAALNQATANESCAFADGMVKKHEDFLVVMAGNTFGHGATSEYVGRNKIDAATLDRFVFIDFPYDEKFEMDLAPNKAWCRKVQEFRKNVIAKKIRTVVSPRATFDGAKLLNAGISESDVIELVIYKGLNEQERNLLKID